MHTVYLLQLALSHFYRVKGLVGLVLPAKEKNGRLARQMPFHVSAHTVMQCIALGNNLGAVLCDTHKEIALVKIVKPTAFVQE